MNKKKNSNQHNDKAKCFRAYCPIHDWEGMSQYEREDAEKDLVGHKELFPGESHEGSKIKELDC